MSHHGKPQYFSSETMAIPDFYACPKHRFVLVFGVKFSKGYCRVSFKRNCIILVSDYRKLNICYFLKFLCFKMMNQH